MWPIPWRYGRLVTRRRADSLLAERGLAPSRSAAAASVRAGRVRLGKDGAEVAKPSELLPEDADLVVIAGDDYVSRGGTKLANALEALPVETAGRLCLDVGASTGGFTDVLLRPRVKIAAGSDPARAKALHERAHSICFIANSVNFPVRNEPVIEVAG